MFPSRLRASDLPLPVVWKGLRILSALAKSQQPESASPRRAGVESPSSPRSVGRILVRQRLWATLLLSQLKLSKCGGNEFLSPGNLGLLAVGAEHVAIGDVVDPLVDEACLPITERGYKSMAV